MSLTIDLFVMCEGAATDARGALTLVGIGQNVVQTEELPARTSRTFAALVSEDDETERILVPGNSVEVNIRVVDPDGKSAGAVGQSLVVGEPTWPHIPSGVGAVAGLSLQLGVPGKYEARLKVVCGEAEATATHALYVVAEGESQQ